MAKYGECISGRPSYQTHRQTYYPTAAAAAASLNGEAEAVDASGGGKNCSRSGGSGGVGGDGQGGTRFCSRGSSSSSATATSIAAGSISQRDPVYPRSLAEEVVWRQRRFAWWGTTYLVDAVSAVPPPSKIHPNPAQLKVQQILRDIRIKDVSFYSSPPFPFKCRIKGQKTWPEIVQELRHGRALLGFGPAERKIPWRRDHSFWPHARQTTVFCWVF